MSIIIDPDEEAKITHQNLPSELQIKFSKSDIYYILDSMYLADDDEYLTLKICEKRAIIVTEDELKEIITAHNVYLRQIGIM